MKLEILRLVLVFSSFRSIFVDAVIRERPQRQNCVPPTLKNGNIRPKQRGKLLRFECARGFTLMGNTYAACVDGHWDTQFPFCAKRGCTDAATHENGFVIINEDGLYATAFCKEHFQLAGSRMAYCNGTSWDRPLGTCRPWMNSSVNRKCDFEVDDQCGWTNDESNDNFEWRRETSVNTMQKLRTGPKVDHTIGHGNNGHFMLLESKNRLPMEVSRLISPVYPANFSQNSCFRFYYHMYGASVGSLRVYIMPESVDMETVTQENKYLYFEKSGNQQNNWHEEEFEIEEYDEAFQIIVEGSAGSGRLSDIAIDDVALLIDDECPNQSPPSVITETTLSEEDGSTGETNGGIFDYQSCQNRCNETVSTSPVQPPLIRISSGEGRGGFIKTCDCFSECEDSLTCCPDYRDLCVFSSTESKSTTEIQYFISSATPYETTVRTTITTYEKPAIVTEIIREAKNSTWLYFVNVTDPTTTTMALATLKRTPSMTRTTIQTQVDTLDTQKFRRVTSTGTLWTRAISLATKIPRRKIIATDLPRETISIVDAVSDTASLDTDPIESPLLIIVVCLVVFIFLILIFGIVFRYYRQNYGPENYKKNSAKKSSQHSNDEDFSEIRFLTSDEHLDFTLQSPVDRIIETSVSDEIVLTRCNKTA